jgi:hypothetical protein
VRVLGGTVDEWGWVTVLNPADYSATASVQLRDGWKPKNTVTRTNLIIKSIQKLWRSVTPMHLSIGACLFKSTGPILSALFISTP